MPSLGQSESDSAPERPESERYDDEGNYRATVLDIEAVHGVFAALKPLLPPEMVDKILDIAEYWACSTQTVDFTGRRDGSNRVLGNSSIQDKLMVSMMMRPSASVPDGR